MVNNVTMEENLIQERLEKLSPYLRGIIYDQNQELYIRIHVMIPRSWNYKSLIEAGLVLGVDQNDVSFVMILGLDPKKSKDLSVDALLNYLSEVIDFNKKEEKKRKLLLKKIKMMEQMSLEDIENLTLPSIDIPDEDDDNYVPQPFTTYVDPMIDLLKRNIPVEPIEDDGILKPKTFDESYMYDGYEIIPDDPENPERAAQLQREYYQRQQELAYQRQQRGGAPQQPRPMDESDYVGREPIDRSDAGFKPMPNMLNNLKDNY